MANNFIQVAPDSNGKMMQTFSNNISSNIVHAEAVVHTDNLGNYLAVLPVDASSTNVTVQQSNASNFLATVSGTVAATQSGTWNIGTVTTLPANSSFNLSQLLGTTIDVNSGPKSAGTQRVVIATDQPQLTNLLKVDASGVNVPVLEVPDGTSTYAPTNATVTAYSSNLVIKGSAGVLFAITGYNSSASDQFIQLFNATSVPSDGAVPVIIFKVRTTRNFSLTFGKFGRFFSTGIVICNSSTGPTKTIGASDCWFDAQFK